MNNKIKPTNLKTTRALLVGLRQQNQPPDSGYWPAQESILELAELGKTCQIDIADRIIQTQAKAHPQAYVGPGKLSEIKTQIQNQHIDILIADDELSPRQYKFLETELKIKIMDRTSLILEIFSRHARTFEAQLQVEQAQLNYRLPRLTRMWTHLSRLGGGIGTRGPGEKQLEVDKRQIHKRLSVINDKLKKIKNQRSIRRDQRHLVPILTGAIVGYTNSGKSTLMNRLTHADVLVQDQLFATLDPTTRQCQTPNKETILLTDTVGFIQKLPHLLVNAFHATLEETLEADFLLRVVDISHPNFESMIATSTQILKELGAERLPQLFVFNKMDRLKNLTDTKALLVPYKPYVLISARDAINIDLLLKNIDRLLSQFKKRMRLQVPYARMDILNLLYKYGQVLHISYEQDNIVVDIKINRIIGQKIIGLYSQSKP